MESEEASSNPNNTPLKDLLDREVADRYPNMSNDDLEYIKKMQQELTRLQMNDSDD